MRRLKPDPRPAPADARLDKVIKALGKAQGIVALPGGQDRHGGKRPPDGS
jgi:hypothetical protein